eukprot:13483268-Alexandrium_andersonii.AAC.1
MCIRDRGDLEPPTPSRPGCGSPWPMSSARACRRAMTLTRTRAPKRRRPLSPSGRPGSGGPSA